MSFFLFIETKYYIIMSEITINHSFNILHILTIVFVILKLCDIIDWKWIMVLLPSIIDIALCLIALIIFKIIVLIESRM